MLDTKTIQTQIEKLEKKIEVLENDRTEGIKALEQKRAEMLEEFNQKINAKKKENTEKILALKKEIKDRNNLLAQVKKLEELAESINSEDYNSKPAPAKKKKKEEVIEKEPAPKIEQEPETEIKNDNPEVKPEGEKFPNNLFDLISNN